MNIALDATPLTQPTGGIARYTSELSRALAEEFPEDEYWLLSDLPVPERGAISKNLHIGSGPHSPLERKWWLWGVQQEMARREIDLFHGTDFAVPYLRRRPSVLTLHDLTPWMSVAWQPRAKRVKRRTPLLLRMGVATMVITPTEAIRRAAIERFRLDANRVAAVPLAARSDFRPVPANSPRPYFLFVGTLEPRKNLARLLEAWRAVRIKHDVDLVLAGRGTSDFPAPPPETGLQLAGAVPESQLAALYSAALACVYPSLYEGFGLPVLEAMQCGTLAITSRDPAIMEVAAGAAIHVPAEDTQALAEAMAAVAREPKSFQALRERALQRSRDFTWRRAARQTREIYEAARCRFGKK